MRIKTLLAVAAATAALGTAAQATEFVTNGGFENATPSQALPSGVDSYEFGDTYKYGQAVDGWTSTTAPGAGAGAFNVYFASGASAEGPTSPDTRYTSSEVQYLWSRSEEHTSELQSLMRISYAVFCLKKKTNKKT